MNVNKSFDFPDNSHHNFPEMLHVDLLAHKTVDRLLEIHESAISATSRIAMALYLYVAIATLEIVWVQQVVNSAGVMRNWIVEILAQFVLFLEEFEQLVQF